MHSHHCVRLKTLADGRCHTPLMEDAGCRVQGLDGRLVFAPKTEMTEAEHAEEMAQKDYENLMAASQKTRRLNARSSAGVGCRSR